MVNPSKDKGTRAESRVVAFLKANGFPFAERRALAGNKDCGDIAGIPNWVIEVKDRAASAVPTWLREAETEAVNANVDLYAVWAKRQGTLDPGRWHVYLPPAVLIAASDGPSLRSTWPQQLMPVIHEMPPLDLTGYQFVRLITGDRLMVAA